MRALNLYESAADELKEKLPGLKKTDYDTIDNLMKRISKRYEISGKKLHDLFVGKYGHTPDTWIKKYKEKLDEKDIAESTASGINKMFNNLGDPVYANLQRVALLAMQGRQQEAHGRLMSVIKDANPQAQKKIIDAVNNIKPVTINGKVADSSTLDKSKQHQDWILNTFIPWVQSLLGQQSVAEGELDTEFAIFHDGQPVVKFKTRSAAMEFLNMLYEKYPESDYILKPISKNDFYEGEVIQFPKPNNTQSKKTSMTSLQKKRAMNNRDDNKVTPIHQKYTTNANNIHDIYEQMIDEAANAAQQAAIAISMKKAGKKPKKKVNEFLEPSRDNGDSDGDREYEILHRLASQWWLGDEQAMIKAERTLASMGWEIGEDEGYDDGGVFVVRAGDINGKSYISWPHEDLQLDESITEDVQGDDDVQKIKDFIKWSMKTLHIQRNPKFTLSKNTKQAQKGHHTGLHSGNSIWIYIGNRNLVDIFRTIFHELVHQRQEELNMIKDGDSYPGSPIEALADMMAGKYIKIYGKEHPEIFQ